MTVLLSVGCLGKRTVTLYITAPESMQGADVLLDGKAVARLERTPTDSKQQHYTRGSVAIVQVPLGTHQISVVSRGKGVVLERTYHRAGEDYVTIP